MDGDVLASIDPRLCVQCKAARGLCGIDPCPLLAKVRHVMPKMAPMGKELFGSSPPALFVGRYGYPKVNVGPMLPPEHLPEAQARDLDAPGTWMDRFTIPEVVGLRSSLVRTTHHVRVDRAAGDKITNLSQELAIAARPVDTEVTLTRAPKWDLGHVGEFTAPHGPTAEVERATLAENVRVERRMESVTSDTDLRAADALWDLYQSGTDPYQLERVLSAGMVGQGRRRRLVPTRWSITATDDTLGKELIDRVRDLPTIDKPMVFRGDGFGNLFLILLLPRAWGYDNIEVWLKGSFWAQGIGSDTTSWARDAVATADWEDHRGRTTYARTAGGYYAARLPILEWMQANRRQATAICLREITDEYTTPLGVWVVREACRRAMATKPLMFEDMDAALRHMDRHALHKGWQADAELLQRIRRHPTLETFWNRTMR